jgi:HD-like signal output (HDOD) protein
MIATTGKSNQAQHSASEIETRIGVELRNIGIPPRPAILSRIDAELHKDQPDFNMLADVISSDVGLAASVIKVSNSPYFGFNGKVRSVMEALLVLGLKVTVHTIAGIALQRTFPRIPSLERFWDSTARTARVCGWLAVRFKGRTKLRPDDAYTFGLFRDCGIPLLMIPFPEYPEILRQANNETERLFTAVEDERLSINHALIGSEMAEEWRLPAEIHDAIRHHHDVAALTGALAGSLNLKTREFIAIAQIGEYLIQQCTGQNRTQEWGKLGEAAMQQFDVSSAELDALVGESREVITAEI